MTRAIVLRLAMTPLLALAASACGGGNGSSAKNDASPKSDASGTADASSDRPDGATDRGGDSRDSGSGGDIGGGGGSGTGGIAPTGGAGGNDAGSGGHGNGGSGGSTTGSGTGGAPVVTLAGIVSQTGGTISDEIGSVRIEIPPGALLGDTTFTVTALASLPGLPAGYTATAGTAHRIAWTGAGFAPTGTARVRIRLPPPPPGKATSIPLAASATQPNGETVLRCPDGSPERVIYTLDGTDSGNSDDLAGRQVVLGCPDASKGGGNTPGAGAAEVDLELQAPPGSDQPVYPAFSAEPYDITAAAGDAAVFQASADGQAPLAFQWSRDGVPLPGGTSSAYSLVARASDNGARFSLAVSNAHGTIVSHEAMLTVAGCQDHVLDGDESDVDCGGHCAGCDTGGACRAGTDCASAVCASNGTCAQATCSDGVRNQGESGIDCGGTSPCGLCGPGSTCQQESDCQSNHCLFGQAGKICSVIDACPGDCAVVAPNGASCVLATDGTDPRGVCKTFGTAACVAGACQCAAPTVMCQGSGCVDPSTDRDNCSGCGATCGWACASAACVAPVEIGVSSDCVRDASGRVACWGAHLPHRTDGTQLSTPTYLPEITDVVQLSRACALQRPGQVICWGDNTYGQVGNGTGAAADVWPPVTVSDLSDAVEISSSGSNTCARRAPGQVVCWGLNNWGQLGDGTTTRERHTPVAFLGVSDAVEISAGGSHTCVRRQSGAVVCLGRNDYGQLGDGTTTYRSAPVSVVGLNDAVEIEASSLTTCARRASGQVACWGFNGSGGSYGVLGAGTMVASVATPVAVSGLTDAAQISLGLDFGCARRINGDVVCWGVNSVGQLGNPDPAYSSYALAPVPAVNVKGVVEIASHATEHTCARRSTGEIDCWGYARDTPILGRVPAPTTDATIGGGGAGGGDNTGAGGAGGNAGGGRGGAGAAGGAGFGRGGNPLAIPDAGASETGPSNSLYLLTADPSALAVGATTDFVDPTPLDRTTLSEDTDGSWVFRTQLVMAIERDATVAEINRAITGVLGSIAAMTEHRSIIVVNIPDPGNLTTLEIVRARLEASTGVKYVRLSTLAQPGMLPPNPAYIDPTQTVPIENQLAARASAAWNLRGLLATPALADKRPAVVVIDYFGKGAPEPDHYAFEITDDSFGEPLPAPIGAGHGYEVAGVIGAAFDNPGAAPEDAIVGLFPENALLRSVDLTTFGYDAAIQDALQEVKNQRANGRNVIVNHSLGDDLCIDATTPCPEKSTRRAHMQGQELIRLVAGDDPNNAAASLEDDFLMFAPAGNNPSELAYHISGPNAAAAGLNVPVSDTEGPNTLSELNLIGTVLGSTLGPTLLPKLNNILSVEAREYLPAAPSDPRFTRPYLPPAPSCLADFSTLGASVGAIGTYVHTLDGPVAPHAALVFGTSYASPQAAATAAWIWSLAPDLPVAKVKQILLRTAVPTSADPTSCDLAREGQGRNVIDAYSAALATDNPGFDDPAKNKDLGQSDTAPARLWLLDVASVDPSGNLLEDVPDGKFTQADIVKLLKEFRERAGKTDYSRYDLNGNSSTGEPYARTDLGNVSRFDLDGDLVWGTSGQPTAHQTIEGQVVGFDEELPTDLSILIYYAYSPLYTGNEYERTLLLLPYLEDFNTVDLRFATFNVVAGMSQTVGFDVSQSLRESTFVSNCGLERGVPFFSGNVTAAAQTEGMQPVFMKPLMTNRIKDQSIEGVSCSSFVATLPSTGRWWINAAARHQGQAPSGSGDEDNEYQMRVYLGEPDLAAEPAGSFTPPAGRLATQTIQYGRVLANELNPTASYPFQAEASFPPQFHLADIAVTPIQ